MAWAFAASTFRESRAAPPGRLGYALKGAADALRRRAARRATERALAALDNRALADIGLHRSEITSVVVDRSGERRRSHDDDWRLLATGVLPQKSRR